MRKGHGKCRPNRHRIARKPTVHLPAGRRGSATIIQLWLESGIAGLYAADLPLWEDFTYGARRCIRF